MNNLYSTQKIKFFHLSYSPINAFQMAYPCRMQYGMPHMTLILAWLVLLPERNAIFFLKLE